jgi:hypothetical protein
MASATSEAPITDSVAKINGEVAVGEDLNFQRRWWQFEHVVWWIFIIVIGLDLAGAFGRGPLANATRSSSDHSVETTYERVQRSGTPSIMSVTVNAAGEPGHVELEVSDSALSGLGLQRVIPAPETTTIRNGGVTYRFPSGSLPATVRFEFQPVSAGVYHLILGAPGKAAIRATIAVMP